MQITDLQMVHKQLNNSYIPQYIVVVNIEMSKCGIEGKCSQKHNTHYLRIKCVLQAHHENNAYCVRIRRIIPAENDQSTPAGTWEEEWSSSL